MEGGGAHSWSSEAHPAYGCKWNESTNPRQALHLHTALSAYSATSSVRSQSCYTPSFSPENLL